MYAGDCRSETGPAEAARRLAGVRVLGGVRARVQPRDGRTRLADLAERGGYRMKFPAVEGTHLEAIQINTGGGVAGGDRLRFDFAVDDGGDAVFSTQGAERIYRSLGPAAEADIALTVGDCARLDWLPQETILYSGARLKRRFEVDVAPDGSLLIVEMVTFGRIASGETMGEGLLHDVWRVRRGGRLIFAEGARFDGDIAALLARPAIAGGARAMALLLLVAPQAQDRLEAVRGALSSARAICAASAWNGMLTARFLGDEAAGVRQDVMAAIGALGSRRLPRVWTM